MTPDLASTTRPPLGRRLFEEKPAWTVLPTILMVSGSLLLVLLAVAVQREGLRFPANLPILGAVTHVRTPRSWTISIDTVALDVASAVGAGDNDLVNVAGLPNGAAIVAPLLPRA